MPEPIAEIALTHSINPFLAPFLQDESGQDLIEYALLATFVALGSVAGTAHVAGGIANSFTNISNSLNSATSVSAPATPPATTPPAPPPPRGGRGRRGGGGGGGFGGDGGRHGRHG